MRNLLSLFFLFIWFNQFHSQKLLFSERTFWYGTNHNKWSFSPQIFNKSKSVGASLSITYYRDDYYQDPSVNWIFEYTDDGYCYISNENSKLYLQPEKSAPTSDARIIQSTAIKTDIQKWFLVPANETGYYIVPKTNEKLSITYAGGSLLLKEFQKENQIFYFDFYNECFAENTFILDENNSEIPIKAVIPGMKIQSYNPTDKKMEIQEVKELVIHTDKPTPLTKIVFTNSNLLYANNSSDLNLVELEVTQNHPVLTNNGIKKISDITTSDKLVYFNSMNRKFEECEILSIVRNNRVVNEVYNIHLNSDNLYLVHGIPASSKCPFVYLKTENEYQFVDEILRNHVSKKLDKIDSIEISKDVLVNHKIEIKIEEKKDEISFLDHVYLKIGEKIIYPDVNSNMESLLLEDNKYLQLEKGNSIVLTFNVPNIIEENSKIHLFAKGYYELLPDSTR
jgi:hypothetical protein